MKANPMLGPWRRLDGQYLLLANVPEEHRHVYRRRRGGETLFGPEPDYATWSECHGCPKHGTTCIGVLYWVVEYETMPDWCEPAVRLSGSGVEPRPRAQVTA